MSLNPLGRHTEYPESYAPEVLFPVPRASSRIRLPIKGSLPFSGHDMWRGYELSWLDGQGMPQVAVLRIVVPQHSPNLVESKSLKLYLNSLNQTRFSGSTELLDCMSRDLSSVIEEHVQIEIEAVDAVQVDDSMLEGSVLLETRAVIPPGWQPEPQLLVADANRPARERLHSHLFRSRCPVTGQPDWGTVILQYQGAQIEHGGLLRYILSYREHQGYHEDCVERIFCDLWQRCQPEWLMVGIQFLRRGGLEINPWRWSDGVPGREGPAGGMRLGRQ